MDFFLEGRRALPHSIDGNLALKFILGQPHKRLAAATVTFFACTAPLNTSQRAFNNSGRSQDCGLQKKDPHGPIPTRSVLMVFQSAKVLPLMVSDSVISPFNRKPGSQPPV